MSHEVWGWEVRDVLKAPDAKDGIFYTLLERFATLSDAMAAINKACPEITGWEEIAENGLYKSAAMSREGDSGYRVYRLYPACPAKPVRQRKRRFPAAWRGVSVIPDAPDLRIPPRHIGEPRPWSRILRRGEI